jgi:hypothetical protein
MQTTTAQFDLPTVFSLMLTSVPPETCRTINFGGPFADWLAAAIVCGGTQQRLFGEGRQDKPISTEAQPRLWERRLLSQERYGNNPGVFFPARLTVA